MASMFCKMLFSLLVYFLFVNLSYQQDCSASNPCAIGCCSSSGWCGMGPKFCGKDACVANCERKSDCNPGWGMEWSLNDKCPLDVCCSEFGFCGTTKDFCGDKEVERPSCSSSKGIDKVIGYYESWSLTERSCNGLLPEEIPIGIYTHINFAFATIDPNTFEVKATSSNAENLMQRMSSIKLLQPDIKLWIAIGGWTFSDSDQPTARTFSILAASKIRQQKFAKSLISMMSTYGFDGVDIDWVEYPVAEDRNGDKNDYLSFTAWMESLKGSLGDKGLSVTLPSSYWYLQHFDITHLEKHVDWFNVMLYDLHGAWDLTGKWTGPYINSHTNMTEINNALDLLWRNNIKPEKVVYGMAFYGRSFTLANPSCSGPGCTFVSGGNAGECSNTVGVLLNPEIKKIISDNNLKPKLYEKEATKTISWGSQWVSYDDEDTWKLKGDALKSQCITNVMVWAISHDDNNATNAVAMLKGLGKKVEDPIKLVPQPATQQAPKAIQLCRWSNCGEQCPSGFKNVPRDGTTQNMVDNNHCLGVGTPHQWCCPGDTNLPTCTWRGHRNSGICKGGCLEGEVEVGTIQTACNFGHQSACCTDSGSTHAYGMCKWVGNYPTCSKKGGHADCPSDYPNFVVASSSAAGGVDACETGARSYCCQGSGGPPDAFTDCAWYKKPSGDLGKDKFCETSCPKDTVRISMQKLGGCQEGPGGWGAYCCKGQPPPKLKPRDPTAGNKNYDEFKALVTEYMKNPTCPADQTTYDYFNDLPARKRSLVSREQCSARNNFRRLVNWMARLIMSAATALNFPDLIDLWDDIVAGALDEALEFATLFRQRQHTNWDPVAFMTDVMLNAQIAGPGIREYQAAETLVCEMFESRKRELSEIGIEILANNQTEEVDRRHITPFGSRNPTPGQPTAWTILSGIRIGSLTLNYARWQYYAGTNNHNGPAATFEPFLELAYWIGPTVGVQPSAQDETNLNLAQYRDASTNSGDRWVVFHIHFEQANPNLFREDRVTGDITIGTPAIRMYHGRSSSTYRGDARVDNNPGNPAHGATRSGLMMCPQGQYFYLGQGARIPPGTVPTTFRGELQQWARRLWDDHIVDSQGLSYVWTPRASRADGQFDLSAGQPTMNGRDNRYYPYTQNWRPNPNAQGGYDYSPNVPP